MAFTCSGLISIPVVKGSVMIEAGQIIRIEACSNYSRIYCTGKEYPITVAKVLHWFQDVLPAHSFIRIHRTHLVNIQFIKKNTGKTVELENGEWISISRRRRKEFSDVHL